MTSSDSQSERRVALVTGSSRGIGRAIAIELARIGCDVMINYVANESAAEETRDAAQLAGGEGMRAEICKADITEGLDRSKLIEATRSTFDRLDFLVNN